MKKDHNNAELEISTVESSLSINSNGPKCHAEEPCSMISFEESDTLVHTDIIRQPSPPPVLAEVQDLIPDMSPQATDTECRLENSFPDNILRSEAPLQLHIVSFSTCWGTYLFCNGIIYKLVAVLDIAVGFFPLIFYFICSQLQ